MRASQFLHESPGRHQIAPLVDLITDLQEHRESDNDAMITAAILQLCETVQESTGSGS